MTPTIKGILETVLYSRDLDAMADFYTRVLGLSPASDMRPLSVAMRIAPGCVLLIFDPDHSSQPGREVPSHGSVGPGHLALRIEPEAFDQWADHLEAMGVALEQQVDWPAEPGRDPGRSIYLRDPAGNSVELITADIWPGG